LQFSITIIKKASGEDIRFELEVAALRARGQATLTQLGLPTEQLKTIIVEVDGDFYIKSDAALKIASLLQGSVRALAWFKPLPRWLRDPIYMLISNNRYRWFGKKSSCR